MSSVVPILPEDGVKQLVDWIQQQCCSENFDPMRPDFQAAIAYLASCDAYRQERVLNLTNPDNIATIPSNDVTFSDVSSLSQILLYRRISRKMVVPPSIERAAMQTWDPSTGEMGRESSINLSYLREHTLSSEFESSAEVFRKSFLTGAGHGPSFLVDRRRAVLESVSKHQILTSGFRDTVIGLERKKLDLVLPQRKLRQDMLEFELDPLGQSLPDYSTHLLQTKELHPRLSPHHVGLKREYDMSAAMDGTSQSSQKLQLRQIMEQANRFRNELGKQKNLTAKIKADLEKRLKDQEKERMKAKRSEEKFRWDLLKQKNMAAYREEVKNMKDKRIQHLLDQTDHYMKELMDRISRTHTSGTVVAKTDTDHKYDWEIKLPDYVQQPDHLTGTLKEYQVKGLQWLVWLYQAKLNGILADEMGLGKTIQTIALLAWLFEKANDRGPHLICAPLSTLPNWESEFGQWFPQFRVVKYIGSPMERKELEKKYINRTSNVNAILTSYEYVTRDKSVLSRLDYSYIIIDEAHKLKNHQGKLSQTLNHYQSKNRLLLTGTPLQNSPRELWSLLNFILPTIFNDHNKFDDWFQAPFAKAGEDAKLTQEETWVVISQLHDVLRPFLFRRMKSEVADQLPDKKEATILCAMSAWQHSMYLTMDDHSMIVNPDLKVSRMDNKQMQCRKICNHPYLFLDTYYVNSYLIRTCGKFELLDRLLPKLYRTGHRVLIFSQMTELLDLLEDFLKYLHFMYLRLDGSTKSEDRPKLMEDFNRPGSEYFIFLLSTRAGGLGLNLQTADTVIIYDNDWNPFADMQASSRVHRIGQSKEVLVLNLTTNNSVEKKVMKVQNDKKNVEDMIIGAAMFNDDSNVDERKAMYEAITAKNQKGSALDVPDDDQINKIVARTPEEIEIFEEMDRERDEKYQREWEEAGHEGDYPRLVTYDELPDYLKIPVEELIKEEDLPDIRKSRSRNQLALENITESEFTRFIEDGMNPEEHLDEIEATRQACRDLIKQARGILGDTFDTLPTKDENPMYYEIIRHPIEFKNVKARVKKGDYSSVDELVEDLRLMARNALTFNDPSTHWYKNAERLLALVDGKSPPKAATIPEEASDFV